MCSPALPCAGIPFQLDRVHAALADSYGSDRRRYACVTCGHSVWTGTPPTLLAPSPTYTEIKRAKNKAKWRASKARGVKRVRSDRWAWGQRIVHEIALAGLGRR